MPRLAWILLVSLSLLWGGAYLSARIAAPILPPMTLVLARVLIAALALHAVLAVMGRRMPTDRRSLADFAVMGVLNNIVPFGLIFFGTATIGAGLASILNATTPIFTALVFHLFTGDDRLTPGKVTGVLLGFGGVAVMLGPSALGAIGGHLVAEIACLLAALSYAFATLWARRFRGRDPVETACGQLTASTVISAPLVLLADRPWMFPVPPLEVVLAVVFLGLVATALAYVLFFRILTLAGSGVMLVTFLVPVSAILLGAVVLGERLTLESVAGMALIFAGLAAIDGRLRSWLFPARAT
jgi:drug/metabolite transporter (DMT)-like permease